MGYERDDSHIQRILQQAAANEDYAAQIKLEAAEQLKRPFMLLRPKMGIDGNMWFCLYGEDLQSGVCGFGETPEKASADFDYNWKNQPAAKRNPPTTTGEKENV